MRMQWIMLTKVLHLPDSERPGLQITVPKRIRATVDEGVESHVIKY